MTNLFEPPQLRSYALPDAPPIGTVLRGQQHLWTRCSPLAHKTAPGGTWETPDMRGTFTWGYVLEDGPLYPLGERLDGERDPFGSPEAAFLVLGPTMVAAYLTGHEAVAAASSIDGIVIGPFNVYADFAPKTPPAATQNALPAQAARLDLPCPFGCGADAGQPCMGGCPAAPARTQEVTDGLPRSA